MTFRDFWQPLVGLYVDGEARAIARLVMERRFGLSMTDIACGAVEGLDEKELDAVRRRLLTGEPVQYVLGEAEFCGRMFHVEPGVLIPRPETEWLCRRITNGELRMTNPEHLTIQTPPLPLTSGEQILDIGTGSGCIACTLALDTDAEVVAWDISDRAIDVARGNASALGAKVTVEKQDVLRIPDSEVRRWDFIVSNPPYICEQEKKSMHENVLGHEPAEALFVPDDDPLLFYRAIASYAARALKPEGRLLLEINPLYASELRELLQATGFDGVEIAEDLFGKKRFAICRLN